MPVSLLSIAAPAYNEAEHLAETVSQWIRYLSGHPAAGDFEIVICNDGSRDRTGEVLDELAATFPSVRPVHHPSNRGAAAALATAIANTGGEWVLLLDSDGQYDISNLDEALRVAQLGSGAGVIGVRVRKQDSWFARVGSWASGRICNISHGTQYRDFNCAFKLVSGPLLRSLTLEARGLNYSAEVTSKLAERGEMLAEIEVVHGSREAGTSSARSIRAAMERLLFVLYLGFRQFLLRVEVLRRPT